MQVFHFVFAYVVLGTVVPVYVHFQTHGLINVHQIMIAFFCSLNILISFWEISLGRHITFINKEYLRLQKKFKNDEFGAVTEFFLMPLSIANIFSSKFWSRVWSTYSLYDPSYSNIQSYGFFIDVGNGWSTLIPSFLFMMGISIEIMPARALGIMGVIKFYQEFYGTVLYFLSYMLNERYRGKTVTEVALFVGLSNGLWFFFPLLGMYLSIDMIYSDSFAAFL
jgi:hypothetical protein